MNYDSSRSATIVLPSGLAFVLGLFFMMPQVRADTRKDAGSPLMCSLLPGTGISGTVVEESLLRAWIREGWRPNDVFSCSLRWEWEQPRIEGNLCALAPFLFDSRSVSKHLVESVFRELDRVRQGSTRRYRLPLGLDRFHYEFFLDVVRTAKQFYRSFAAERDRVYATIGQYVALYRRAMFPVPQNWWEEHLAMSVQIYKLGVATHALTHTFRGGFATVEWDLYPLADRDRRLSLMVGPLGILKETLKYRLAGVSGKTWFGEAVVGLEGQWRRGLVLPSFRVFWMPRYARFYAHRLVSELSVPVRIGAWLLESDWVSDMRVVPKFTYYYISEPVVVTPKLNRKEALRIFLSFLPWLRFRNNVTFYVQVEFRLRK